MAVGQTAAIAAAGRPAADAYLRGPGAYMALRAGSTVPGLAAVSGLRGSYGASAERMREYGAMQKSQRESARGPQSPSRSDRAAFATGAAAPAASNVAPEDPPAAAAAANQQHAGDLSLGQGKQLQARAKLLGPSALSAQETASDSRGASVKEKRKEALEQQCQSDAAATAGNHHLASLDNCNNGIRGKRVRFTEQTLDDDQPGSSALQPGSSALQPSSSALQPSSSALQPSSSALQLADASRPEGQTAQGSAGQSVCYKPNADGGLAKNEGAEGDAISCFTAHSRH